jgi:hypothetical protein
MFDARQLLRILTCRGIEVRLQDDRLVARPAPTGALDLHCDAGTWRAVTLDPGPLPADMVAFIRHFKNDIIAELKAQQEENPAA